MENKRQATALAVKATGVQTTTAQTITASAPQSQNTQSASSPQFLSRYIDSRMKQFATR
jgi:hypothetical protein